MYPTMQNQYRAAQAYQTAAETVTAAQAIVMLYDGAIRRVSEARRAIGEKRIEDRYHSISRAYAIVNGLQCHLDFDAGGEVARLLDRYYTYILHRLTEVNIQNDAGICDEILERLREMRSSWARIADDSDTRTAPDTTAQMPAALTA